MNKNTTIFFLVLIMNVGSCLTGMQPPATINEQLLAAAKSGEVEKVSALIRKGAHVTTRDIYGETPLHSATFYGHIAVVKALLEEGAAVNAKNFHDQIALHLASTGNHIGIVNILLAAGAAVTQKMKLAVPRFIWLLIMAILVSQWLLLKHMPILKQKID